MNMMWIGSKVSQSVSYLHRNKEVGVDFLCRPTYIYIPDDDAKKCMVCDAEFNPLLRRKHHCRVSKGLLHYDKMMAWPTPNE